MNLHTPGRAIYIRAVYFIYRAIPGLLTMKAQIYAAVMEELGRGGIQDVSPESVTVLLEQMDRQIALGKNGYICVKANAVTEREVIDKLAAASRAGVEVQLIIRGICCILPGVSGDTENIHLTSVVGRFLEHARIYLFGRGENAEVFLSSADLMTRNLNRRVEIACPVQDTRLRDQLKWILESQLRDTAKASFLLPDGTYCRKHSAVPFDSQAYFTQQSPHLPAEPPKELPRLVKKMNAFFRARTRAKICGAGLIVLGIGCGAISRAAGGTDVLDFVSGILMGLSIAQILAGIGMIWKQLLSK